MGRVRALVLAVMMAAAAAGCAKRGALATVAPDAVQGVVQPVWFGTTRKAGGPDAFGPDRSEAISLGRLDVAIPPDRKPGDVTWPGRRAPPNPERDFVTVGGAGFDTAPAFRADLGAALRGAGDEAVIFVHGYNTTFPEGIYRIAQLSHDLNLPGVAVHYGWPSRARPLGYVYDRDSVLFARDGLEVLIRQVRQSGARRIHLVAHSLGSMLTMEALRQIALRGDRATMGRIAGVVLISPDIDVEVFRQQVAAIGTLPQPFVIVGSREDNVLRLSSMVTGQSARLGAIGDDLSAIAGLEVRYLDVSAFTDAPPHFSFGDSPQLIRLLGRLGEVGSAFDRDRAGRPGLLPGVLLSVRNATRVVLLPVTEAIEGVTR